MNETNSVAQIIDSFSRHALSELHYKGNDFELMLRRDTGAPAAPLSAPPPPVAAATPSPASQSPVAEAPPVDENLHALTSPLVGTFYTSPAPGKPAYVQVGSRVKRGETVAIVEAMKLMNTIEADVAGVVEKVLLESGTVVEYGTPLVLIRKE